MPWHSLCFPMAFELCERVFEDMQMDPFSFVRSGWPGKVLFCFGHPLVTDTWRPYTDVWTWCPNDPLPLVQSMPKNLLVNGHPIWTCQRFWDTLEPRFFFRSMEQQFLANEHALSLWRQVHALMACTRGLDPIETFFPAPVVSEISDVAGLQIFRGTVPGARSLLLPSSLRN